MKKKLSLVIVGLMAIILSACSDNSDKKIATVNDAVITQGQLDEALMKQYGTEVLDTLMTNEIIKQEAKKQKVTATDEEVDAEFQNYADAYGGEDEFLNAMKSYKMDKEDIRSEIKTYLLTYKLISKDIKLTDEEIQTYYNENADSFTDADGEKKAFEDVKDQVKTALMQERVDSEYEQWLDEKFEEYDVKTYNK